MIDEINKAIEAYHNKWHKLVAARADHAFFESLKPTAIGWKVAGRTEYDKVFAELHDMCDQIVDVTLNDRWIAKMHLKDTKLSGGIEIIKLMQHRPASTDAVGLDHLDFYSPDVTKEKLAAEKDLAWTEEENGLCRWLSIWFEGTEAKLRPDTVIDVCIAELQETNQNIIGKPS
ncbi:MAG TPA: hypothetical protein VJ836_00915 [Candidatus Saccharimonadales bacterium]|nr:hypothetical protein [Candidatus Saccharimonadales bacterium]